MDSGAVQQIAGKYIKQTYLLAGIEEAAWKPELGFRHNRSLLDKLYYYYQELYFKNPQQFLWAGLQGLPGGRCFLVWITLPVLQKTPVYLRSR
jgi:hypothetical protein